MIGRARLLDALVRPTPRFIEASANLSLRHRHRAFLGSRLYSVLNSRSEASPLDLTNEDLVQRRLRVAREKREARNRSLERRTQRNLQLKRLLSTQASSSATSTNPARSPLYAIKVTVADDLRAELQLSGREKRGRVFVESALRSLRDLRQEMHSFFRALRKDTYVLRGSYPILTADTSLLHPERVTDNPALGEPRYGSMETWPIENDDDVVDLFAKADTFFQGQASLLSRPTIVVHVHRNPNAPPPPPPPAYLTNLANPQESPTLTMLSFYAFPPNGIDDVDEFAIKLRKLWKPFEALGRVYVAYEGVNAQMSVPTNVLMNFIECCRSIPEFGDYIENGINVDPIPLSRDEFAVAGGPGGRKNGADGQPPFRNLYIRVRNQVVADGLDKTYNWQSAGYDMPALEWHRKIKEAKDLREQGVVENLPIILDCRNSYETEIGSFEGAQPLNTNSFRESWSALEERLAGIPKDTAIMTFCTGGIRCVKVGAYLTQEMGFSNVSRLASGIIGYDRSLKEAAPGEESMFKGTNFVFDGRLGRPITEDSLGTCLTCGSETSLICNCRNENCHKRFIQCENCRTSFHGTCSDACRQRLVNGAMAPRRSSYSGVESAVTSENGRKYSTLEEYSSGHSSSLPSPYQELIYNTQVLIPSGSHMISSGVQGRLLTQLASMTREARVLELGTFTGFATTCLLEGVINAAAASGLSKGSRDRGPYVLTLERDARAFALAARHLEIISNLGFSEESAEQLAHLRDVHTPQNLPLSEMFVSLNSGNVATCDLVQVTDALAAIEEMASGSGLLVSGPFDLVFVDADKTRLIDYVNVCLSSERLLKKGGFIVVDNVLYKGLVLEAAGGDFPSLKDNEDATESEVRTNRRARRLANKLHRFNEELVHDDRAEVLVLPLRDGLSVIRKK